RLIRVAPRGYVRRRNACKAQRRSLPAAVAGPRATSNSGHRHCLPQVVRGVTARLFLEQQDGYLAKLRAFDTIDLAIPDGFEATMEAKIIAELEAAERLPEPS